MLKNVVIDTYPKVFLKPENLGDQQKAARVEWREGLVLGARDIRKRALSVRTYQSGQNTNGKLEKSQILN